MSIEFNSFLSYYENAPDLNNLTTRENSRGRSTNENMTRFFINLGRKDRLNPAKLIGLINEQNIGDKVEIGSIDILDTFSFFEIDKNYEGETLASFEINKPDFNGRNVNIEITKTDRGSGGRRRRVSSSGGGFKGRNRKKSPGEKSFPNKGFGRKREDRKNKRTSSVEGGSRKRRRG